MSAPIRVGDRVMMTCGCHTGVFGRVIGRPRYARVRLVLLARDDGGTEFVSPRYVCRAEGQLDLFRQES